MKFLKHVLNLSAVTVASLALTSCFEHHITVNVSNDGSGTVEERLILGAQVAAMMAAEAGGVPMLNEDNYKTKASEMGEGVEFVSVEELKFDDGRKGALATYKFADVSKLRLEAMSDPALEDIEAADPDEGAEFFAFEFKAGTPATLTINLPAPDAAAVEELKAKDELDPAEQEMQKQMMKQMAPMMQGMRSVVEVTVDGKKVASNASHVSEADNKTTITLYDVDMGKLFADEKVIELISDPEELDNFTKLKAVMATVEGLKFEEKESVTITFE